LDEKKEAEAAEGVSENFGLSQFWYTDATAQALARAAMASADAAQAGALGGGGDASEAAEAAGDASIAILCSPTCLKGMRQTAEGAERRNVKILEYDHRFGQTYPDEFVFYDVHDPQGLVDANPNMAAAFDAVLSDPPYTDAATVRLTMDGMQRLAKLPITPTEAGARPGVDFTPCLFVSALLSRDTFLEFGFRPTTYRLSFASKFATPMYTYTNFEPSLVPALGLGAWLDDGDIGDQQNANDGAGEAEAEGPNPSPGGGGAGEAEAEAEGHR